jgi:protein-disulfide isomerase
MKDQLKDISSSPLINYNFLVLLVIMHIAFSVYLFTQVKSLKSGTAAAPTAAAPAGDPSAAAPPAADPTPNVAALPKVTEEDHVRGNRNAKVMLIEYSDLECPFCKTFHPTMQQIMQEYGDQVGWVYRHYPLSFHAKAQKAGEAVECAAEQGGDDAFWTMTDAIYERMPDIEVNQFADLATELGLDGGALQTCLDSDTYAQRVKDQQEGGSKTGVSATPTTILLHQDGSVDQVVGAYPYADVKAKLDALLAK